MIAQGVGSLAAGIGRIALAFLRATVPDLMVLGGFGVAVLAAFTYSRAAGEAALAAALVILGVAISDKKKS